MVCILKKRQSKSYQQNSRFTFRIHGGRYLIKTHYYHKKRPRDYRHYNCLIIYLLINMACLHSLFDYVKHYVCNENN